MNTVKHAQASRAAIFLRQQRSRLMLSIEDNGVGLPKEMPLQSDGIGGMGLEILGYRARSIGGRLLVENLPKRGVRVICYVPRT
jgi:two-component system NarL family sensor kinase